MAEPTFTVGEILAHKESLVDPREGMEDLSQIDDSKDSTKNSAMDFIGRTDYRTALCNDAVRALRALVADGFPDPIIPVTNAEIAADAEEQARTIQIARDLLRMPQAAVVTTTYGPAIQKEN